MLQVAAIDEVKRTRALNRTIIYVKRKPTNLKASAQRNKKKTQRTHTRGTTAQFKMYFHYD